MTLITKIEQEIKDLLVNNNIPVEQVKLVLSGNPEYGEYQINEAFKLAKVLGNNPVNIANQIKDLLLTLPYFKDVNVSSPGFINLTFNENIVINYFNDVKEDITKHIDKQAKKTIFLDYGGPNASKALHVGHLRSANIGEAMKRLLKAIGFEVISDIHIGDRGTPAGMVLVEMERRNPELEFFKIQDNYPDAIPYTVEDLKYIYPEGSTRAKADESVYEQAKLYAKMLQDGHPGLNKLWQLYMQISVQEIKQSYKALNIDFDLWEGETDSFKYFKEMDDILASKKLVTKSEGATVIFVNEPTDKKDIPPLILYRTDGAALYGTTDLATILGRIKRFQIDEMWYLTDKRQALHFEQVFRASNKAGFTDNIKLVHIGFGTMNAPDGKPFKTRDGGVLSLSELVTDVKAKTMEKISDKIDPNLKEEINHQVAISVIKYADLLPICSTDYIFDVDKFADTEGKTGPYLLYSSVRIKSLLKKATIDVNNMNITKLKGNSDYQVLMTLLNMPVILTNAYLNKTLNELSEYLYKLNAAFNKFYAENQILNQEDESLKTSWLALSKLVLDANLLLLNILAIDVPDQM